MSRPFSSRFPTPSQPFVRINGRIRAREVRVVTADGQQLGVMSLGEAINHARAAGVDLVEVAPNAQPPVCRLIDHGKFRYEQAKKLKEAKHSQHANKLKEIQLRASIDDHDFAFKVQHAIDFLCDDMKVKVTLRFRGRELAHQEFGVDVVNRFVERTARFGTPDSPAKKIGRGLSVMLSPLPKKDRAQNPNHSRGENAPEGTGTKPPKKSEASAPAEPVPAEPIPAETGE